MQQQKAQSQAASQFTTDYHADSQLDYQSDFHGYEQEEMEAKILAILQESKNVDQLSAGAKGALVLDHTPFYAESGGQVGDKGLIVGSGFQFRVEDTQKKAQAIVHYGEVLEGTLGLNQFVHATIDKGRRHAIRLNHTATHLLHAALKTVLGDQVQQKGSLVDAERARFDFSHFEALTAEQIQEVDSLVNEQIRANHEVVTRIMNIETAKKSGAVALFGEKYADEVRVLSMGEFSKELCGGTHVQRTGDIGLFKITAEYGVASGVRRIEIVTGHYALDWVNAQQNLLADLSFLLKTTKTNLAEKITQLMAENKSLEKELTQFQSEQVKKSSAHLINEVEKINGINLLVKELEAQDSQGLRTALDQLKSQLDKAVLILFARDKDKINVVAGVSKTILGQVPSAADLVKHLCGKGGGREDMAQGGGLVPPDLEKKIEEIRNMLKNNCP
jgi:alanyl-tRNA synthetase